MGGAVMKSIRKRSESPQDSSPSTVSARCESCVAAHVGKEIEVVFVRHGQSQWNFAQKNWHIWDMAKRKDHPLSTEGQRQCEELRHKIQLANDFPAIEVIFSSPLARAIETAILVFPNHLRGRVANQPGRLSMVLLPNAREKLNFGGRDSESSSVGQGIVDGAFSNLTALYDANFPDESPASATTASGTDASSESCQLGDALVHDNAQAVGQKAPRLPKRASILNDRMMCHIDVSNVEEQWCRGTSAVGEGLPHFLARLNDFMHQLMHSNFKSMCVVGHSHFIRMVFREYFSKELCSRKSDLTTSLKKSVIPNCGVVQCKIACGEGGHLSITDVNMLCDTPVAPPDSVSTTWCGCQAKPGNDPNELIIDDSPTFNRQEDDAFPEDLTVEDAQTLRRLSRISVGSLPAVEEDSHSSDSERVYRP